ncbi:MAG: hypothetical protein DMF43_00605 [Verrucomicrobia bacterium]|nr:MAG: hypothetical protein DMF43_00605 [Verrucomicrobiota bacterium]
MSLSDRCNSAGFGWLGVFVAIVMVRTSVGAADFRFDRDTPAFANQTVFEYHEGHPSLRKPSTVRRDAYKRHCFVLCRTAMQFKKFARFDPRSAPLDDTSLAARIRTVTHREPWADPLPEDQRITFPGYKDLREMSKARRELVQLNIGHGWPSYFRISNARMVFQQSAGYQENTHAHLNAALARGQLFVGFLTTYPRLSINHSVLVYKRKPFSPNPGVERYLVYDPNHTESPRELTWSPRDRAFSYQKDWDFVGGFVRVYQVYGKWLQ